MISLFGVACHDPTGCVDVDDESEWCYITKDLVASGGGERIQNTCSVAWVAKVAAVAACTQYFVRNVLQNGPYVFVCTNVYAIRALTTRRFCALQYKHLYRERL